MKIGVLSDSHLKVQYTQECVDFLKSIEAQYIIHAGDICLKENLDILKNSSLPYVMWQYLETMTTPYCHTKVNIIFIKNPTILKLKRYGLNLCICPCI